MLFWVSTLDTSNNRSDLKCVAIHQFSTQTPSQLSYLSNRGKNASTSCWNKSTASIISYCVITLSTSTASWNRWPPSFCFGAGKWWKSVDARPRPLSVYCKVLYLGKLMKFKLILWPTFLKFQIVASAHTFRCIQLPRYRRDTEYISHIYCILHSSPQFSLETFFSRVNF